MSPILLSAAVCFLLAGAVLCAMLSRAKAANAIGGIVAVVGAAVAIASAVHALQTGDETLQLPWSVPFGSFHISIDGLSAFFILAISAVCALGGVYGVSYLRHYKGKNLGASWFFFNLLFASMLMVVTAWNAVLFLAAWEVMSLSSFFLVTFEHERQEVRKAGWVYLISAHVGMACLLAMFILLGGQNQVMDFDQLALPPGVSAAAIFLLAVVGFGAKAGICPMHVWLPDAHPAAPSHVSAVMSGVMIKTGIYGILRTLTFLGSPASWPGWWGWTLLVAGAITGVVGILFALAQHDMKRVLAYSSIENVGVICLGLGLWMIGSAGGNTIIAALGLIGALLHVWNHAIFKSLMFLGAGAVVHATGTRNIEQLGGLLKPMKHTGVAFAVGSIAICGLPPFNGFVGEFLIYASAFGGIVGLGGSAPIACLLAIAALALIGGLAAVCFTRLFGIMFLGEPRSEVARHAHEAGVSMRVVLWILAGACVLVGLVGPLVAGVAALAAEDLLPSTGLDIGPSLGLLWRISGASAGLIVFAGAFWLLRRRLHAGRPIEKAGTWDCGYAEPTSRMQYTASSFSWPVIDMFRHVLRPTLTRQLPSGPFPGRAHLTSRTHDIFMRFFYVPLFAMAQRLGQSLRWVQHGRNQVYVLYIAVTLLALLLWKLGTEQ